MMSDETSSSSEYSRMPFNSFSAAFLIAALISSAVASFSSSKVTSTREPVGIYIGNGQFIHAASGINPGVVIDKLNSNYYIRTYVNARRVL